MMTPLPTYYYLLLLLPPIVTCLWMRASWRARVARLEAERQSLMQTLQTERQTAAQALLAEQQRAERDKALLRQDYAEDLKRQKAQLEEQMDLFQDRLQLQTQAMLAERQQELQHQNDVQMESLLRPLHQQIASLQEQLHLNREDGIAKDARLREMLNGFVRQASEMGAATDKLANAMMSNGKVHGDWGEQVLERILESCGMQSGVHYEVQRSTTDEGGHEQRPDVYILCPRNRKIVIDSKVSLTAYANYLSAKDHDEAKRYDEENYRSVKAQVDRLAAKAYHKLDAGNYRTVLMFVPNEGAYILAMRHNAELGQYAYNKGVVILTPTNLMITLQLIEGMWQKENEEQNIQNILKTAGDLYEKFASFSDRMAAIHKALDQAGKAYDEAVGYLSDGRGNVIRQLDRLAEYGAKYNRSRQINAALQQPEG